jgi:hypothetical protein
MSTTTSSGGCLGFLASALFLLFLILKLLAITAVAHWSWWLVTAPLWGYAALCGVGFVIVLVITVLTAIWIKIWINRN